jgi:hypothetical protein
MHAHSSAETFTQSLGCSSAAQITNPPQAIAISAEPSPSAATSTEFQASFGPRRFPHISARQSLDGYDVSLVDLVESIEHNRPKSSRQASASGLRSSVRSSSSSARYSCGPS